MYFRATGPHKVSASKVKLLPSFWSKLISMTENDFRIGSKVKAMR